MTIQIDVSVSGMKKLRSDLTELKTRYGNAVAAGVFQEAVELMRDSRDEVPIDTGELFDSAFVAKPDKKANGFRSHLGYGADHAIFVHERTELSHPIGKAKFLTDPSNRRKSGASKRIADTSRRHFTRGTGPGSVSSEFDETPNRGSA